MRRDRFEKLRLELKEYRIGLQETGVKAVSFGCPPVFFWNKKKQKKKNINTNTNTSELDFGLGQNLHTAYVYESDLV